MIEEHEKIQKIENIMENFLRGEGSHITREEIGELFLYADPPYEHYETMYDEHGDEIDFDWSVRIHINLSHLARYLAQELSA